VAIDTFRVMATHQWRVVAELAAAQHGVVTRAQAAELGFPRDRLRSRLRAGIVDEPRPNVLRIAGSRRGWHQDVQIACLAYDAAAALRTAGRLQQLDGLLDASVVELMVVQGRHRHVPGIEFHRARDLDPCDVTMVDGIPTTSVARTLCDLGAVCDADLVERALDDALRRGFSLRWIEDTLERLDRPGPSGTGTLRRVLARSDRQGRVPGSWRERVTQRLLAHPELTGIVRQYEIRGADGHVIARPDLAVVDAKVGIEYHSDQWHYGPRRGRGDRRRDFAASRVGWELLYLDASDHRSPVEAVEGVLDVVRLRRAQAG
jgi:hypothetical protein